jgi:hypothetical protein
MGESPRNEWGENNRLLSPSYEPSGELCKASHCLSYLFLKAASRFHATTIRSESVKAGKNAA